MLDAEEHHKHQREQLEPLDIEREASHKKRDKILLAPIYPE